MWHIETDFFALAIFLLMFKRKKRPEPTFTNPFTGLFFKLSENIEYERGILFMPVGVGMIMLYSVIGLLMVIFYCKKLVPKTNEGTEFIVELYLPVCERYIKIPSGQQP